MKSNALDTLAYVLIRQGKFEEARRALEEAVRLRSDSTPHPEHLFRYYLVLEALGRREEAFRHLARAYQFFANDELLGISGDEIITYFIIEEKVISDIFEKWNSEASKIYELMVFMEETLRGSIHKKPNKESEISDQVETLLLARKYKYTREKETICYSTKVYIPDFVLPELNICLEVKFSKKPGNEKRIISEINDDIIAYKTKYKFVLFVIYDIGTIRDTLLWKKDIISDPRVYVVVVKH